MQQLTPSGQTPIVPSRLGANRPAAIHLGPCSEPSANFVLKAQNLGRQPGEESGDRPSSAQTLSTPEACSRSRPCSTGHAQQGSPQTHTNAAPASLTASAKPNQGRKPAGDSQVKASQRLRQATLHMAEAGPHSPPGSRIPEPPNWGLKLPQGGDLKVSIGQDYLAVRLGLTSTLVAIDVP
ncbi:hypothetical protein NDU88_004650 [Pleurodeles waltl]|uniref:Uncharacterized protein n=1 Tax=Pleurodeles waltl TaxID=8319 RepID=A0AAV7UIR7_PLEWA|nr:hypothetical protein NDU88_004650 [Pleurodeles waltl]